MAFVRLQERERVDPFFILGGHSPWTNPPRGSPGPLERPMVIVIVADQHSVDGRQIVKCYTRLSPAPPSNPGKRTRSYQVGSVKRFESRCWSSTVEWFTRVIRSP